MVLRRNECGCLYVHGAAVLETDFLSGDMAPFADGAVLRGLQVAGLFHPLLCSFCGFTALFPKGTVLLQLLFACLFRGFFSNFQLLTDNVSYSLGNAGKKIPALSRCTQG